MKPLVKNSLALTLAGVMTLAAVSPTFARSWRYGAAANAAVYGPAYQAYAYAPGQIPGNLGYGYQSDGSDGLSGCAVAGNYGGKTDYGAC
jgi:hypothetical protein